MQYTKPDTVTQAAAEHRGDGEVWLKTEAGK